MPLPPSLSWLANDKDCLGAAEKIRPTDHVGTPSQRIRSGRPVYQIKSEPFSFHDLVKTSKLFKGKRIIELS